MGPGQLNFATTFDAASRLALITLDGLLLWKIPEWLTEFGFTDLAFLNDGLDRLTALRPRAVLLHLSTHGGPCAGVPEAAMKIQEFCRQVAPVYAYSDTYCLSSGMWLASGCSFFHASPSTAIGSIGAVAAMFDSSAASAQAGKTVHLRASGPLKGAGFPGTRPTDRHLEAMQSAVDEVGAEFRSAILRKWPRAAPGVFDGGVLRAGSPDGSSIADGFFNSAAIHAAAVAKAVLRS